jgi:hypothetical protein
MFGWFRPMPPCDPAAKRWVEDRLRWLNRQFGLHVLLERPILLPTVEFFPDPWDGSRQAAGRLFHRVCEYMGVDPEVVQLKFFDDRTPRSGQLLDLTAGIAVGTWTGAEEPWQKGTIRLERGLLGSRLADLIGILAHELAHQRLLGERRIEPESFDNELLTDLTAVFSASAFSWRTTRGSPPAS